MRLTCLPLAKNYDCGMKGKGRTDEDTGRYYRRGSAGLLLSQILHVNGIDSVILERQTLGRTCLGGSGLVFWNEVTDTLRRVDVGDRIDREGQVHGGVNLAFGGRMVRIDLEGLTGGKTVTVYGQTEVTRDLYKARDAMGGVIIDETEDVTPHDLTTDTPALSYRKDGEVHRIECDFVAACDGFHGVGRQSFPSGNEDIREGLPLRLARDSIADEAGQSVN